MLRKLIRDWTKADYAIFGSITWLLVFGFVILVELIEGRNPNWGFAIAFSFLMIPIELIALAAIQKYSSNLKDLSAYPALLPNDFKDGKLLRNEKIAIFFYAEWCPYWRKSFEHLKSLEESKLKVFRVDLSDEDNALWASLKIRIVPTLIIYKEGTEIWRANGISMVGLRKRDFKQAITESK